MTGSQAKPSRQSFCRSLSLIVQGPLTRSNAASVAETCEHWRRILPDAFLILAVSKNASSGLPDGSTEEMERLHIVCDEIILAPPAERLPPVKAGLGSNHVNLQIAAAHAGLERVRTRHVLRIRNDMTFCDDGFIDYYLTRRSLPRSEAHLLGARILISPWFTLNPLTVERLPFHFSDWFHLGDTADVRELWAVPQMSIKDATYYSRHPVQAPPGSREAAFHSRLAAEQHLIVHAARGLGASITLPRHNDLTDTQRSFRMLADDFAIADFTRTPIRFDKYAHLAWAADLALICIDDRDWHALVGQSPALDPVAIFGAKIAKAQAMLAREADALRRAARLRALRRLFGRRD